MQKLILHVGMSKTATTTVQTFLSSNRQWLLERGVLYPQMQGSINHRLWGERLAAPVDSVEFTQAHAYFADTVGAAAAAHPDAAVLISFEGLFELSSRPRPKQRTRKLLASLSGFDVRPLAYLRRQDRWYESVYNQHVKTGGETDSLEVFVERLQKRGRVDLDERCGFFCDHFGPDNVTLRVFEPSQFSGGGMLFDFCEQLGIDSLSGATIPANTNRGLSGGVLEAKRAINPALKWLWMRRVGKHASMYVQRWVGEGGARLMPYSMATQLMEHHAAGNERVAREFLNRADGRLFTSGPVDEGEWEHFEPPSWLKSS